MLFTYLQTKEFSEIKEKIEKQMKSQFVIVISVTLPTYMRGGLVKKCLLC